MSKLVQYEAGRIGGTKFGHDEDAVYAIVKSYDDGQVAVEFSNLDLMPSLPKPRNQCSQSHSNFSKLGLGAIDWDCRITMYICEDVYLIVACDISDDREHAYRYETKRRSLVGAMNAADQWLKDSSKWPSFKGPGYWKRLK